MPAYATVDEVRNVGQQGAVIRLHQLAYICRLYPPLSDDDRSLSEFRRRTHPALSIRRPDHQQALFEWLNSWGCRQFSKRCYGLAARSLLAWADRFLAQLPRPSASLVGLSPSAVENAAGAYGVLKESLASRRARNSQVYRVTYGPTGAAKVLFGLRPAIFPPWDDRIREHFGYDGSPESYGRYLRRVQGNIGALVAEAKALGLRPRDIPRLVGRPGSTLVKLLDEYYWVVVTKEVQPASADELWRWAEWAKPRRAGQRARFLSTSCTCR